MHKISRFKLLIHIVIIAFLGIAFENCGIQQPGLDSMDLSSVGYTHTGQETSCNQCHLKLRPTVAVGLHKFSHTDTRFGGDSDCISCHRENAGVSWANGKFDHTTNNPKTCIVCHENQRPNTIFSVDNGVGVQNFDHAKSGLGDCINCHTQTTRYIELSDWAPGEIQPAKLVGDRKFVINVTTPSFNGTVMTKSNPVPTSYPLEVLHSSNLVTGVDCLTCHSNLSAGSYKGGQFHPNITTNPVACLECHKNADPVGIVGTKGFMRHEATSWEPNTENHYSRGLAKIVTQDCGFCHSSNAPIAGAQLSTDPNFIPFNGANFHGNILPANLKSCLDCHAGNRPSNSAGWSNPNWVNKTNLGAPPFTTFDLSRHALNVDCVQCHLAPNSGNSSPANWSNGKYNHTSPSINCLSCHANPTGVQSDGVTSFDHANIVANCVSCHSNSITNFPNPGIADWKGGFATPAGTVGEKSVPSSLTCTGVNAAIPNCTPTLQNKIPKGMTHSAVTNSQSCQNCHGTGVPTASNGKFHTPPTGILNWVAPTVGSCLTCHDPTPVPANLASIKNLKMVGSQAFMGNGVDHGHTQLNTLNCNACHTAPTPNLDQTWNMAPKIHTKISSANITSCKECHYKQMPNGPLPRKNQVAYKGTLSVAQKFSHTNSLISINNQECAICHKDPGGSYTSTGTVSFHNKITVTAQCTVCHVAPLGNVTSSIGAGSFDHSNIGTQDCASCHAATLPKISARIPSVADWDGGVGRPHPLTGTTAGSTLACNTCHGPTGSAAQKLAVPIANHYNQATTCIGCHSDYTDFNTKLKFNHTASTGTCTSCHNFSSGSYSSYTKIAVFNKTGNFTLPATTSITGTFDGDSFTSTHADTRTNLCSSCHKYAAPAVGVNIWNFIHRPSNPGVTNTKSTQGCNLCH